MNRVQKDKIHIIGAAILDVLVVPAGPEVFQTGSYPAENIKISFGGDAINEATVLSALGKKVRLNTTIGTDPEGDMICRRCEKMGIELTANSRQPGLQTGINVVLVQKDGERSFLTNKNGGLRKLCLADVTMPFPEDTRILCFASMFVSPHMGAEEMAAVFRQAKKQGITVCADMTKCKNGETVRDIVEALRYVDYLIPNEEEAYLVTGADTPEAAAAALHRAGAKNVIIKCGKRGCYVLGGQEADCGSAASQIAAEVGTVSVSLQIVADASSFTTPPQSGAGFYVPAVSGAVCVDTTGAGDSFAAGFVYGLSEGWSLQNCAAFANRCGARAIAKVGATSWCEAGLPEKFLEFE